MPAWTFNHESIQKGSRRILLSLSSHFCSVLNLDHSRYYTSSGRKTKRNRSRLSNLISMHQMSVEFVIIRVNQVYYVKKHGQYWNWKSKKASKLEIIANISYIVNRRTPSLPTTTEFVELVKVNPMPSKEKNNIQVNTFSFKICPIQIC